jgi:hypothetical protein
MAWGHPPNVQNTKIYSGLFWAGFHSCLFYNKIFTGSPLSDLGVTSLIIMGRREGDNYQAMVIPQLVIYALALHLIFLFHMELIHKVSIPGQLHPPEISKQIQKDYISINSGSKKVYQKQVTLCDSQDANLNS